MGEVAMGGSVGSVAPPAVLLLGRAWEAGSGALLATACVRAGKRAGAKGSANWVRRAQPLSITCECRVTRLVNRQARSVRQCIRARGRQRPRPVPQGRVPPRGHGPPYG